MAAATKIPRRPDTDASNCSDCYGKGAAMKFAEIVAATVLWCVLSLGSALVAEGWVRAHELSGANRP